MDTATLRNRVLSRAFKSPWVLAPLAFALPLVAGGIATASPFLLFGGVCLGLGSIGIFGSKAINPTSKAIRKAADSLRRQAKRQRDAELDFLDKKLQLDGDPRTEALLRDLRVMIDQFHDESAWDDPVVGRQLVEVSSKSERLFTSCVRSLERSFELHLTAERMSTPAARQATLQTRERLIKEVEASVAHLGKIFDGVHSLGLARDDVNEMARIRGELDETLNTARRVEERMRQLDEELDQNSLQTRVRTS